MRAGRADQERSSPGLGGVQRRTQQSRTGDTCTGLQGRGEQGSAGRETNVKDCKAEADTKTGVKRTASQRSAPRLTRFFFFPSFFASARATFHKQAKSQVQMPGHRTEANPTLPVENVSESATLALSRNPFYRASLIKLWPRGRALTKMTRAGLEISSCVQTTRKKIARHSAFNAFCKR